MRTLVLSDIHLGNGQGYDIYAGAGQLTSLVDRFAQPGHRVFFNGDTVDFLMNEDPLKLRVARAVEQAQAITANPETAAVMAALGRVLAAGGEVVVRLGNHDVELAVPEVQQVFRDALGQPEAVADRLAFQMGDEPEILEVGGARVVLTHGEHDDDWNRLAYPDLLAPPDVRAQKFAYPPGSRLVKTLMNPLKRRYRMRFADLLKPDVQGAVLTTLAVDLGAVKTLFKGSTVTLMWQLFKASKAPPTFADEEDNEEPEPDLGLAERLDEAGLTQTERAALHALLDDRGELDFFGESDESEDERRGKLKLARAGLKLYARVHRGLAGRLGEQFFELAPEEGEWNETRRLCQKYGAQALVMGHTHAARFKQEQGLTYLNTGTWIWLVSLPDPDASDAAWAEFLDLVRRHPALDGEAAKLLITRLTGAVIEPHEAGGASISLVEWKDGALHAIKSGRVAPA